MRCALVFRRASVQILLWIQITFQIHTARIQTTSVTECYCTGSWILKKILMQFRRTDKIRLLSVSWLLLFGVQIQAFLQSFTSQWSKLDSCFPWKIRGLIRTEILISKCNAFKSNTAHCTKCLLCNNISFHFCSCEQYYSKLNTVYISRKVHYTLSTHPFL